MAIISSSQTYQTTFTPAVGDFVVQVAGGTAYLEVQSPNSTAWGEVGPVTNTLLPIYNPVAGTKYRWRVGSSGATVIAEQ